MGKRESSETDDRPGKKMTPGGGGKGGGSGPGKGGSGGGKKGPKSKGNATSVPAKKQCEYVDGNGLRCENLIGGDAFPCYCDDHKHLWQDGCNRVKCIWMTGGQKSKKQCTENQDPGNFPFCMKHGRKEASSFWRERPDIPRPKLLRPIPFQEPVVIPP